MGCFRRHIAIYFINLEKNFGSMVKDKEFMRKIQQSLSNQLLVRGFDKDKDLLVTKMVFLKCVYQVISIKNEIEEFPYVTERDLIHFEFCKHTDYKEFVIVTFKSPYLRNMVLKHKDSFTEIPLVVFGYGENEKLKISGFKEVLVIDKRSVYERYEASMLASVWVYRGEVFIRQNGRKSKVA